MNWAGRSSLVAGNAAKHGYLPYRLDNPYKGSDRECTELVKPFENGLKRAKPSSHSATWQTRNDAGLQHVSPVQGLLSYRMIKWVETLIGQQELVNNNLLIRRLNMNVKFTLYFRLWLPKAQLLSTSTAHGLYPSTPPEPTWVLAVERRTPPTTLS